MQNELIYKTYFFANSLIDGKKKNMLLERNCVINFLFDFYACYCFYLDIAIKEKFNRFFF